MAGVGHSPSTKLDTWNENFIVSNIVVNVLLEFNLLVDNFHGNLLLPEESLDGVSFKIFLIELEISPISLELLDWNQICARAIYELHQLPWLAFWVSSLLGLVRASPDLIDE